MTIGLVSYRYNVSVHNNEVDANDTLKILGVTLDRKLNFVAHVSKQIKKACAKAYALRRIRRFIPLYVMCRLFKAYNYSASFRILLSTITWSWKRSN